MAKQLEVLASVQAEELHNIGSRNVLLAGEPVFASLQASVPEGFAQQVQLDASRGLVSQFAKHAAKVYVSVDERVFDTKRVRFALAVEGYIAWGLARRGNGTTILFGGAASRNSTNVTIVVFSDGAVVELDEKVLPEASASYFKEALTAMIAELRSKYPNAPMFQAAPLDNWQLAEVEYVGEKALRRISYRPLTRGFSSVTAFVFPGIIAALGLLFYVGVLGLGWGKYSTAISEYETSINDPAIKSQGGIDTNFLNVVNARRVYMDEPRRQSILADKSAAIVRGIGVVPNVQIMEMRLPAPSVNPQNQVGITVSPEQARMRKAITAERTPDVWLSIAVPKSQDPAINQAKDAMVLIANATGMSLRLAHQGWRDDSTARRIFNIEGFMHD